MHRADDLELRVLRHALVDALRNLVVDEDAGEAADLKQIAAFWHLLLQVEDLVLAHLLEVDGDAPCARLGDDAIERYYRDASVAGLLDGAVQCVRRGRVDDDRVITLEDHVLDLRRLLGNLVFGGGERIGRSHNLVGDCLLGDLVPALQHGLTPRIAGIVVGKRDTLARGIGLGCGCREDEPRGQNCPYAKLCSLLPPFGVVIAD